MALSEIRRRLDEDYDALHLLDALPSHKSMKWIPYSGGSPPEALVIGIEDSRHILAFLTQHGDKVREVRYSSTPINGPIIPSTTHSLAQHDVMVKPLIAPFKYNADVSKSCKRKSSILFKWYFMLRGLWVDGIPGDYTDYCSRFYDALRKIQVGQEAEKDRLEESPEPVEPRSPYGLRSAQPAEDAGSPDPATEAAVLEQLVTPVETPSTSDKGGVTDYDTLCQYLDGYNDLHLLDNIPDADRLGFADQDWLPEGQPKKLFIGRLLQSEDEIYAYMKPNRPVGGWHEIHFWVENPSRSLPTHLSCNTVVKHRILHPFNKTYPKDAHPVEQGDRARLTLMIKWYFIAAGIAKDVVLRETKAYPERLRSALEYIAARMGRSAAKPRERENSNMPSEPQAPPRVPSEQLFDESHIQSDLAATPQPDAPAPEPSATAPSPRGTKRTAEEEHWEEMARIIQEERTLTKQINNVDAELEILDIEKQNFMEEWENRQKEVMNRRMVIDGKRKFVRKQHSRQSMAAPEG
ncbi:hypothetical protein CC86DRAFT_345531 [Ophiobolus disseminans]|uniref:Uncharacterized protein n=1 Tax=Ophiobolus disseminans TaxID=1469910 RepID=A0A6A7A8L4_9PLEO|nr:hypothetical protein CC86DRAFT_345531 [Ophiobolus disseminans]